MLGRVGVLLVVVTVVGCGGRAARTDGGVECDPSQGCTQMGCPGVTGVQGPASWEVVLVARIAAPARDLAGSELTACLNDVCRHGTLDTIADSFVIEPGDVFMAADVYPQVEPSPPLLEVGWGHRTQGQEQIPNAQDGDVYTIELRTSGGAVVAATSGVARYWSFHPNGECCGPACPTATFTIPCDGGANCPPDQQACHNGSCAAECSSAQQCPPDLPVCSWRECWPPRDAGTAHADGPDAASDDGPGDAAGDA